MPKKDKVLKLSDILNQFDTENTLEKNAAKAGDPNVMTPDQVAELTGAGGAGADPNVDPNAAAAMQQQQIDPATAAAMQQQQAEQIKGAIADAAQTVVAAGQQYDASVEALKNIAKQAQEKEEKAVVKEASEFGKIFAEGFFEAIEEKQIKNEIIKEAYDMTVSSIHGLNDAANMEFEKDQYDAIVKEAYDTTLEELAQVKQAEYVGSQDVYIDIAREAYQKIKSELARA